MTRTHLITGVAGQDGVLLARLLRARGDDVVGTVLPEVSTDLVAYLDGVTLVDHDVRDIDGFVRLVESRRPAVVHNLAAMSSVGASWEAPDLTREVNQTAVGQMLDVLIRDFPQAAFVQASSSEIFGPGGGPGSVVDEKTSMNPVSPYAEAKAEAHRCVVRARERGLRATNLILFGHTSALQADRFVLPTITRQAVEVALGHRAHVELQDPRVRRDWGSAADVVRAFAAAADAEPCDVVIGTGHLQSLGEVVSWALAAAGAADLPPTAADGPERPHDFDGLVADPRPASAALGWEPRTSLRTEIEHMVQVARLRQETGRAQDPAYLSGATA